MCILRTQPPRQFAEHSCGLVRKELSKKLLTSDFIATTYVDNLEVFGVLEHLDVTWEEKSSKLLWGLVRKELSKKLLTSDFCAITHIDCLETFRVLEHLDVTWKEKSSKLP